MTSEERKTHIELVTAASKRCGEIAKQIGKWREDQQMSEEDISLKPYVDTLIEDNLVQGHEQD